MVRLNEPLAHEFGRRDQVCGSLGLAKPLTSLPYMVVCSAKIHDHEAIFIVMQADDEIQLQVWKDLAISKQMLIRGATDALGLTEECSTEDLKTALNEAIKRTQDADANIVNMREQTDSELSEMKAQVATSDERRVAAEEQAVEATTQRETAERQLAAGRADNAKSLKDAKADVLDKQNKLKAISKALADTPENVVKKLKTLKKQKLDEAKVRTQIESKLRATRKDKTRLEQEVSTQKEQLEQLVPLITQVRELRGLCEQANKTIQPLSEDDTLLLEIPELDEELLESLEKALVPEKSDTEEAVEEVEEVEAVEA
jgi:colicin import membrane protein